MPNTEKQSTPTDRDAVHDVTSGGGDTTDYGGMDQNLDRVDLASASEVGADPPGPLGTDLGGGSGEIGQDESEVRQGTGGSAGD